MTLHVCLLSSHHNSTTQRLLSLPTYIVDMKRKCYSSLFISFVWQRYEKRHEKALGKAWKSGAEGESLKLLKESGAIFSLRTWYPCGRKTYAAPEGQYCYCWIWRCRNPSRLGKVQASLALLSLLRIFCSISQSVVLETCCHHFLTQLVDVSKDGVSALDWWFLETIDVVAQQGFLSFVINNPKSEGKDSGIRWIIAIFAN